MITHSIAPDTLELAWGEEKSLSFNSLVGKAAGCCQALPTTHTHQLKVLWVSVLAPKIHRRAPSGAGGGGGGRAHPFQGSDPTRGQQVTDGSKT